MVKQIANIRFTYKHNIQFTSNLSGRAVANVAVFSAFIMWRFYENIWRKFAFLIKKFLQVLEVRTVYFLMDNICGNQYIECIKEIC